MLNITKLKNLVDKVSRGFLKFYIPTLVIVFSSTLMFYGFMEKKIPVIFLGAFCNVVTVLVLADYKDQG